MMSRFTTHGLTAATTLILVALPAVAESVSGTVIGTDKQPIAGVQVCYMLGDTEGICVETNEQGVYDLPVSSMTTLRLQSSGYQTQVIRTGKGSGPIVLERAAAIWVRVRDGATGRTVPESEIFLVFPSGRREGPLPANDKGVKIRTLVPGRYGVLAHADGYTQVKAVSVSLEPGSDEWIDVEMKRDPKPR